MKTKKIKVLLGAYIDTINAQNINCYHIAKYLNKEKFEIHVLYHKEKKLSEKGIIYHRISSNRYLKNIQKLLLLCLLRYDLVYLPRCEQVDLLFTARFKNRRCIISSYEIESLFKVKKLVRFFGNVFDAFAISRDLQKRAMLMYKRDIQLLYLGCDHLYNREEINFKERLQRVIFIGSVVERKRPFLFVKLAECFSDLEFILIGDGDQLPILKDYVQQACIKNVTFKGRLPNELVYVELQQADLLLMTSKSEGLPKVILEAASVGVPSVYFNEMYSVDYIQDGINGYGVRNEIEMKQLLTYLSQQPKKMHSLSLNAYDISLKYDWKRLIKDYESYFSFVVKKYEAYHRSIS